MEKERRKKRERRKKKQGYREGRDVANKRGKDKESCTNMKHKRRKDFNGWVIQLPSFEVFVDFFLRMLPSFYCSDILHIFALS